MNKKEDKNKVPSFPAPFEYLNEELAPQLQRFRELNELRQAYNRNESKPKDLKPTFTPEGYGQGGPSNNHYKNYLIAEAELQKLDSTLTNRIESLIKDIDNDPDMAKQLRETLLERKYPNPFKDKSPKEIEWLRTNSKDLETSAQFMLDQRRRNREKDVLKQDQIKNEQKTDRNPEPVNGKVISMSTKFTQSLNYTKVKETPQEKIRDFMKNKDLTIEKE